MKGKLLLLFFAIISIQVFAQDAVAHKPLDILQCENTEFTLMGPVVSQILGNQNPQFFTVTFYDTYDDADTMSNTLPPFAFTQTGQPRTIYARVTSTVNGSYDITDFNLIAYGSGAAPNMNFTDITVCGSYTLPNYYGQYYNGAPTPQNIIPNAGVITQTTTITAFSMCNPSGSSNTFTVTVLPYSAPSTPPFTLYGICELNSPIPPYTGSFFTAPNETGILVQPEELLTITEDVTLYYKENGPGCYEWHEVFFYYLPEPQMIPEGYMACDTDDDLQVTLNLTDVLQYSLVFGSIWEYTTYHLTEADASAAINPLPEIYTVSGPQTTLYVRLGEGINTCAHVVPLLINVGTIDVNESYAITGCDPNNDGIYHITAESIESLYNMLKTNPVYEVTFHETEFEALAEINPIDWETVGYTNTLPETQKLYAHLHANCSNAIIREISVNVVNTDDCSNNILTGYVRATSSNNCSATDPGLPCTVIYTNVLTQETFTTFTTNGAYIFYGLPNGPGIVQVTNLPEGSVTNTLAIAVDFGEGVDEQTAVFCASQPTPESDVSLIIIPVALARPGFEAKYSIVLANNGTTNQNGSVTFQFDPSIMIYVPTPGLNVVVSGNTITYNYSNLSPYYTQVIYFRFLLAQPPTLIGGENLTYTATITGTGTDTTPENNTYVLNQLVVNSYDPNDITVHEGESITPEQTDRFLHYTIRFENTGSASAVNIRVETELDPNLDMSTFTPVAGSHPYSVQRNGNKVKFYFNDIELPHTEPDRHGYLTYKIKPLGTVGLGDSMSAFADIFFDFNPAIVTNTVTTTVQIPAGVSDFAAESFTMYPNPASGMVKVVLKENNGKGVLTITDMLGKAVHTSTLSHETPDIDIHNLQPGIYMVSVSNGNGKAIRKLIVK